MKDQKNKGALLSYLNIAMGMVTNLVIIPLMITGLGETEYSLYKVMQSFSGPLMMLNLGISTITARAIVKFRSTSNKDRTEKENTLALSLLIAGVMAGLVLAIGSVMCLFIPNIYGKTYTPELLVRAKQLFMIFTITTAFRILNDVFRGCILGNERFVSLYGGVTAQYILRFGCILGLLKYGVGAAAIAMADLGLCIMLLLFNVGYTVICLKERFRITNFEWMEIKSISSFSVAILLQAIVNQVNSNMDIVILGAVTVSKDIITMYSSALSIYSIYNSALSILVNVYFPSAARLVIQGKNGEELTDFVIKAGRIQAILAMGILTAFGLFGPNFITIWIGQRYSDAYYVAFMMMIPVTIPLVQNVCLAILDAKLKRIFRSVTLVIMALINVMISLILIRYMGFWGAALGTVLSLVIGHGILMNVYYQKVIGLNVLRMFREIFTGILPAAAVSGICCIPLLMLADTVGMFLTKCIAFVTIYGFCLWFMGLNQQEKAEANRIWNKMRHRKT